MKSDKIPDSKPFNWIINALLKDNQISNSVKILHLMKENGFTPDFNALADITNYLLLQDIENDFYSGLKTIQSYLDEISQVDLDLSNHLWVFQLIKTLLQNQNHEYADLLIHHYKSTFNNLPDYPQNLLELTKRKLYSFSTNDPQNARKSLELFNDVFKTNAIDTELFCVTLSRLQPLPITYSLTLFETYLKSKLKPDIKVFNIIIKCWIRHGDISMAEKVLDSLQSYNLKPDLKSLKILLKGYCLVKYGEPIGLGIGKHTHSSFYFPSMDIVLDVVSRILNNGYKLDLDICNIIMEGYEKRGMQVEMTFLYKRMVSLDITPNAYTSLLMARGFSIGQIDSEYLYLDLLDKSSHDDHILRPRLVDVYQALISSQCRSRKASVAKETYDRMIDSGIKPTIAICNILIAASFRSHDESLLDTMVREMKFYNIKPSTHLYNTIISGYSAKDPSHAVRLFYEMSDNDIPADGDTICHIIRSWSHLGDYESIDNLISECVIKSPIRQWQRMYFNLIKFAIRSRSLSENSKTESYLDLKDIQISNGLVTIENNLNPESDFSENNLIIEPLPDSDSSTDADVDPQFNYIESLNTNTKPLHNHKTIQIGLQPNSFAIGLAQRLFDDMILKGYIPYKTTFYHLVIAYYSRGEHELGFKIYEKMWEMNVIPDIEMRNVMYSFLLQYLQWNLFCKCIIYFCKFLENESLEKEMILFRKFLLYFSESCSDEPLRKREMCFSTLQKVQDQLQKADLQIPGVIISEVICHFSIQNDSYTWTNNFWNWAIESKVVSAHSLSYYINYLVKWRKFEEILYWATDATTDFQIQMDKSGLMRIFKFLRTEGVPLISECVKSFWIDKDPLLIDLVLAAPDKAKSELEDISEKENRKLLKEAILFDESDLEFLSDSEYK